MINYQQIFRLLWRVLHLIFLPEDREWLEAIKAEYAYLPNPRNKLTFLIQCIFGAIDIRLNRTLTSSIARLSLVMVTALIFVVLGCVGCHALFPDSLTNWFIDCNPHVSPFDKLLFWQYLVIIAASGGVTFLAYSAYQNSYDNVTALTLLCASLLIASIIISQNSVGTEPTSQAAGSSVFLWQLFSLMGGFSLIRLLQSKALTL